MRFISFIGWVLVRETDRTKTWYKNEEGNPIHSIKIEGIINSPLFNVLAVFNEDQLYTEWIPFLKEANKIKQVSLYRKIVHMKSKGI